MIRIKQKNPIVNQKLFCQFDLTHPERQKSYTVCSQLSQIYFFNKIKKMNAERRTRNAELGRKRTEQSFMVPKGEIVENGYDLSINRYKEVEYEAVEYDPPGVILGRLAKLEVEIADGRKALEGLLK